MKSTQRPALERHQHDVRETDALHVAIVQYEPYLGDIQANVEQHLTIICDLVSAGNQLIIFPELSLTGYFVKDLVSDVAVPIDSPMLAELAHAAGQAYVVIGCILEERYRFYNAAVILHDGHAVHVHKKVFLPTYGMFDDRRYFAAGDTFQAVPLTFHNASTSAVSFRAGVLICEDMWHLRSVVDLVEQDVDLLICLSASPTRGVGPSPVLASAGSYDAMTRTYAQLSTSYVLYCNRVGMEDGIAFWGGSRFIGPDGLIIGTPAGRDASIELSGISANALRRVRIASPLIRDDHDRRGVQWKR